MNTVSIVPIVLGAGPFTIHPGAARRVLVRSQHEMRITGLAMPEAASCLVCLSQLRITGEKSEETLAELFISPVPPSEMFALQNLQHSPLFRDALHALRSVPEKAGVRGQDPAHLTQNSSSPIKSSRR